jgi:hypothetical protein
MPLDTSFANGEDEQGDLTIHDFVKSLTSSECNFVDLGDSETVGKEAVTALRSVTAGLKDWEYKILASAALSNSILCNVLPIIQLIGEAGSGKSQLLIAISEISGHQLMSGQSTGASLKNYINQVRWSDPETKTKEKRCVLLIDNLNEDTFKKEEYLSSFLNGYNRRTDRTYISDGRGENIEFRTFCLKIYTTIWENTSTELKRRTISIRTKKTAVLDKVLDIEEVNWRKIRIDIADFWQQLNNWQIFIEARQAITSIRKPGLSKENWTLMRDLLATGVCVGIWENPSEAIEETFHWLSDAIKSRMTILESILIDAIEKEVGFSRQQWIMLQASVQIYVSPKNLSSAIKTAVDDGLINKPKLSDVQSILQKLHFAPGRKDGQLLYKFRAPDKG